MEHISEKRNNCLIIEYSVVLLYKLSIYCVKTQGSYSVLTSSTAPENYLEFSILFHYKLIINSDINQIKTYSHDFALMKLFIMNMYRRYYVMVPGKMLARR